MSGDFIRPPVDDLLFLVFARPPHPEFFTPARERRVEKPDYSLRVSITAMGHVLTWQSDSLSITEVTASRNYDLPKKKSIFRRRFLGEQKGIVPVSSGLSYQIMNQVERLSPEGFIDLHRDLLRDGSKRGLFHSFGISHRFGLPALGWVTVEAIRNAFYISSFHTFPDDLTVIKTLSLLERT